MYKQTADHSQHSKVNINEMQVFAGFNLNATKFTSLEIIQEILRTDVTSYTEIDIGLTFINNH